MKKFMIGLCLLYLNCIAYDGQLDTSFGNNGLVTTFINNFSVILGVVIQSDNKIVVGGWSGTSGVLGQNFSLARYNVNGTLDGSFGNAGIVITSLPGSNSEIKSIVLQTDGKIVVGGFATIGGFNSFMLARYNTDGSLDNTFGNAGIVISNVGVSTGIVSIALQSDGKIVALGQPINGLPGFIIARYYSNGTLDNGSEGGSGFGANGIVIVNLTGSNEAASIAVQEDGSIVAGGSTGPSGSRSLIVLRVTSSGSLDMSFGINGSVITSFPSDAQGTNLKVQRDGKIVLIGFTGPTNSREFALVRYNSNGALDTAFGSGGIVTTSLGGNDQIFEVVFQADDKLIVGGTSNVPGQNSFVLTRYTANGAIDLTFNPASSTPGTVFTTFGTDNSQISSLALQQNGRIVAAGNVLTSVVTSGFALARYLDNTLLPFTQITVPINNVIFSSPLLTVSGTAQNPSNIGIFADGILIGSTVTSGSANNWSLITTVPLTAGIHVITAVAEYKDGNVNLPSSNSVTIVVNNCRSALSLSIASKYCPETLR